MSSSSCRKKYESPGTIQPTTVNPFSPPPSATTARDQLNALFQDLRYTPEVKCVTAGIAQTVTFSGGTVLTLYPNSFKDGSGLPITSGTICISLIEMYKPGDMISNRATTVATAGILHSGGQVYITATHNGQRVNANKYGIAFRQNAGSTATMFLYSGSSTTADPLVTWGAPDTAVGAVAKATDTGFGGGEGFYFVFDSCSDMGWTNCDALADRTSPRTTVRVTPDDTLVGRSSTHCLIVLHDINSVVPFDEYITSSHTFDLSSSFGHQVPIGMSASIVVINTRANGDIYYYQKDGLTISDGMSLNVTLTKISKEQLKVNLASL
ncbi:hypothetical protein GCM10023093_21410 [Nemorincola caseinilytica]|uniref:Ubiquitin-activating enzyme E1 FCCH domain-containing protein n=1 Tax=Nemorincola caseinilytica TaxID=2054315 RepID=A0ABP8NGT2_9BACT